MTHTSTEQPEALRIADALEKDFNHYSICDAAIDELRRLHARVQELEASQSQRGPLSADEVSVILEKAGFDWADEAVRDAFITGVYHAESKHGITQEKQG